MEWVWIDDKMRFMAELSEVHRTYVGSVERGERNISIDSMQLFALALKIQLRNMFYESLKHYD